MNVHPAATETFLSGSYCDYWRGVYLSLWRHSIRIYTAYLLHNSTEAGGLLPLTLSPRRGEGARMCPKAYGAGGAVWLPSVGEGGMASGVVPLLAGCMGGSVRGGSQYGRCGAFRGEVGIIGISTLAARNSSVVPSWPRAPR